MPLPQQQEAKEIALGIHDDAGRLTKPTVSTVSESIL
jgi:hypothetical protein